MPPAPSHTDAPFPARITQAGARALTPPVRTRPTPTCARGIAFGTEFSKKHEDTSSVQCH